MIRLTAVATFLSCHPDLAANISSAPGQVPKTTTRCLISPAQPTRAAPNHNHSFALQSSLLYIVRHTTPQAFEPSLRVIILRASFLLLHLGARSTRGTYSSSIVREMAVVAFPFISVMWRDSGRPSAGQNSSVCASRDVLRVDNGSRSGMGMGQLTSSKRRQQNSQRERCTSAERSES